MDQNQGRSGEAATHQELILRVRFAEPRLPQLLAVSSLLYDLELAHDFAVLLSYEEYADYKFNRFYWFRKGRPLKTQHRVRVLRISRESPLVLELVVGAVGGILVLLQIIDKVHNWRLNRRKLELEVEKLALEVKGDLRPQNLVQRARERQAQEILEKMVRRLDDSPLVLEDAQLDLFEDKLE